MKKLIPILSSLLVVQLALFAFLATRQEPTASFQPTEALLGIDFAKLDKIVVAEKDKSVNLVKKDGVWILPEHFDFPVSESKIGDFTKALTDFKKSWPVGKTDIAAKQFSVVDEKFERKLTFYQGEQVLKTLYLGTSPSFRKLHARVDGDDFTYSVNFNTYEAPTAVKEWLDKKYLALERSKVKEVQFAHITLQNQGGDFVLAQVPEGKETITTKTSALIAKVVGMDFDEVLGLKDQVQKAEKAMEFSVVKEDGSTVAYSLFKQVGAAEEASKKASDDKSKKKDGEFLVLTSSAHPYAFKVKKSKLEDLMDIKQVDLVKDKEKEQEKEKQAESSGEAQKSM